MPLINVNMAAGRTDDQKRALMAAITQAAQDTLGAPLASIRVWITGFAPVTNMYGTMIWVSFGVVLFGCFLF